MNKNPYEQEAGMCTTIIHLPVPIITPDSLLMHSIGMAIVLHTKKEAHVFSEDIKLYKLSSLTDGSFIGSFYGAYHHERYYGNLVGTTGIITFTDKNAKLEETNELSIPIKIRKDTCYALDCRYNIKTDELKVLHITQIDEKKNEQLILHTFPKNIDPLEALEQGNKIINKILG